MGTSEACPTSRTRASYRRRFFCLVPLVHGGYGYLGVGENMRVEHSNVHERLLEPSSPDTAGSNIQESKFLLRRGAKREPFTSKGLQGRFHNDIMSYLSPSSGKMRIGPCSNKIYFAHVPSTQVITLYTIYHQMSRQFNLNETIFIVLLHVSISNFILHKSPPKYS